VGRLDVVEGFFNERGAPKAGMTSSRVESALFYACGNGHNDVVTFLLQRGVDLTAHSQDGQTGLHWATIGGHLDTLRLLLRHNAPPERRNRYGGTVLEQALWSAAHGGDPEVYVPIVETLIAAGARVPDRHAPVNERVDAVLRRHGCVIDGSLWYFGEKPRTKKRCAEDR